VEHAGRTKFIFGRKKTGETELRKRLGVTILAISAVRKLLSNPGADDQIQTGDYLIMMGKPDQIRVVAKEWLKNKQASENRSLFVFFSQYCLSSRRNIRSQIIHYCGS
jgi:uncharacterized protein with PhoU and TrkA domain